MTLSTFTGLFLCVIVGLLLAVIVAVLTILLRALQQSRKEKVTHMKHNCLHSSALLSYLLSWEGVHTVLSDVEYVLSGSIFLSEKFLQVGILTLNPQNQILF